MSRFDPLRASWAAAPGFVERQAKNLRHVRYLGHGKRRVTFVFGCQRSGTKMLMRILDRSPETRIYHENHASAFRDFQIRSDRTIRALVALSPAPSQIFKPICDSHRAADLLGAFPNARGLWVYRHPDDVANSAVQKWDDHQREVIDAVARGDLETWGWRTARVPAALQQAVKAAWRADLTEFEGALLFWYLRNAFFFALGLDHHPRMLLTRYEDLATAPDATFPRIFEHVGAQFEPGFVGRVHADSVGRKPAPPASPAIRALCDDLLARLDAARDGGRTRGARDAPARPPDTLLLINTLGVGGAERYVVTVANWLAAHGAAVSVAAERGALVEVLAPAVRFHETPLRRVRTDLPAAAAQVRALIAGERPAVIVANSLATTWIARVAQRSRRVPIVNVAHGWPRDRYRVIAPLLRIADRVIAVSPEVKARLVEGGLDAGRIDVIFNGVDCAGLGRRTGDVRTAARLALGAGADHVLVVTLGRLTPQKAHHHVIAIASRLRESHPAVRFAIIGEGARADELAGLVRAAGLMDRVCLPGLRADGPDLLGAADIYLSCSDWEGMPLSTIEAMASGLPVVATRTEGSDQLLDAACGIVVPVGDVVSLGGAVARLAEDRGERERMGEAARARALSSFTHERMASELARVLSGVAG